MEKDRIEICEIVSAMLDNPDECGIYPTTVAYEALEALVEKVRGEAVGWTHADACATLDSGGDPRKTDCAGLLERARHELGMVEKTTTKGEGMMGKETKTTVEFKIPFMAKVKDKVTGITGTVTGYLYYMTGCKQYEVKFLNKDKDTIFSYWLDEERLEVLSEEKESIKPPKAATKGGPSRGPTTH